MPQIIKLTERAVFVICEFAVGQGQDEAERAEQVAATYCRRCGYYREATLNHLSISCFHPKFPNLQQIIEELRKL